MLQRIQTIWLLLAGIATLLTLKLPYYSGIQDPAIPYHELNALSANIPTLILTITIAVMAFITIGLYKTRSMQLKLCVGGIALEALLIYLYYRQIAVFTQGTYALTSILNMLGVLFFVLALRGISNDEKLIKESDRLR